MIADFIKKDIIELYNDLDNTKSTVKQVISSYLWTVGIGVDIDF